MYASEWCRYNYCFRKINIGPRLSLMLLDMGESGMMSTKNFLPFSDCHELLLCGEALKQTGNVQQSLMWLPSNTMLMSYGYSVIDWISCLWFTNNSELARVWTHHPHTSCYKYQDRLLLNGSGYFMFLCSRRMKYLPINVKFQNSGPLIFRVLEQARSEAISKRKEAES